MPVDHLTFPTDDAGANRAIAQRAKGALMRRYGMDTFQAFSSRVRWARETHTPVHTIARTMVHGIDEADPQLERTAPPDRGRDLSAWDFPSSPWVGNRGVRGLHLRRWVSLHTTPTTAQP